MMMNYFWRKLNKEERGFTLVELLVVVVILGILATLALQVVGNRADEARQATADAELRIILSALEIYRIDKGEFPAAITALVPKYLQKLPDANDEKVKVEYTNTSGAVKVIVTVDGTKSAEGTLE